MKRFLCALALGLPLCGAVPAQAAPSVCRAEALNTLKQSAAWKYGSVREKQALSRSQRLQALTNACEARRA